MILWQGDDLIMYDPSGTVRAAGSWYGQVSSRSGLPRAGGCLSTPSLRRAPVASHLVAGVVTVLCVIPAM